MKIVETDEWNGIGIMILEMNLEKRESVKKKTVWVQIPSPVAGSSIGATHIVENEKFNWLPDRQKLIKGKKIENSRIITL